MSKLNEWRESREAAKNKILQMRDTLTREDREFSAEERAAWEAANKDYDSLDMKVQAYERGEDLESRANARQDRRGVPGLEDTLSRRSQRRQGAELRAEAFEQANVLALQAWCFRQYDKPLTNNHRRACRALGFRPSRKTIEIRLPRGPVGLETRAQGVSSAGIGAALVPQGFVANLERALKAFNAVRETADVMRTDTGAPMPWPTANDTGNVGELLAENTGAASQDVAFSSVTFNAYKFSSKMLNVGYELIEDSGVELANTLGDMLGERIGRAQATYFTTGSGTNQPQGIVTGATLGKTAAAAAAIASDELFDLLHSIDPAYRADRSFGWQMHDNVLLAVRKLKDSQNRYLWEPSLKAGTPDRLLNYPVSINQSMASSIATGNKTILVGALGKMKVRDVNGVRLKRLEERYADADQVGFIAFLRSDSKLLDAGGHPIKYLQQA